jgi:putative transposase
MRKQIHYYAENHLHFLTSSTYRRARLFDSDRFKHQFFLVLGQLRANTEFRLLGYVLMPEHFHVLIWPTESANPSKIIASLKERTAKYIIRELKQHLQFDWCQRMLQSIELPESVHDESAYRVWQRRFYDLNLWSEKKRLEKLNYMHANPVKRRLVERPGDWPWSSWRFF